MKATTVARSVEPNRSFSYKLDLFMRSHVLPRFDPTQIHWWLSLSGGKDSFSMAEGLRDWYVQRDLTFRASLFTIDQWHGDAHVALKKQITWHDIQVMEANQLTIEATRYETGQQAPCRTCSDVRRHLTDELVRDHLGRLQQAPSQVNIVARGLHLSDLSVSALWRHAMGKSASEDMIRNGKGLPLSHLYGNVYLAKPLYYVREFESQQYSHWAGYKPACCGCPACRYPSRRDIVEESLVGFLRSSLWEFDVPGVDDLLKNSEAADPIEEIKRRSEPGIEVKHGHLPKEFAYSTVKEYLKRWRSVSNQIGRLLDAESDLDRIGLDYLRDRTTRDYPHNVPMPSIFQIPATEQYSDFHLMTIATLGPFWGAIGLEPELASKTFEFQDKHFGIRVDDRWSQVGELLRAYYGGHFAGMEARTSLVQIGLIANETGS